MDIINKIEIILLVTVLGLIIYIGKWVMDRQKLCGKNALCYLTGNPNNMQMIKDEIQKAVDAIVPASMRQPLNIIESILT